MLLKSNTTGADIFYRMSAFFVFLAAFIMIAEIFITALPDGARTPHNAEAYFEMFSRNWFMAMRHLGLINIIASTLTIPVFISIFQLHYRNNTLFPLLSLILCLLGYAVFISDNPAFAMLALSKNYHLADADARALILAAGEALIAKGSSHTSGTFPGFFLSLSAGIGFGFVMLKGNVFSRATAIIGIVAFSGLLLFEIFSAFIPSLYDFAMIFAIPGGIMAITWYFMVGRRLIRIGLVRTLDS